MGWGRDVQETFREGVELVVSERGKRNPLGKDGTYDVRDTLRRRGEILRRPKVINDSTK